MKICITLTYILITSSYLTFSGSIPYPIQPLIKALPIFFLFLLLIYFSAFRSSKRLPILIFTAGMLASAAGDITLSLRISNSFVAGLGFFLMAHLCYSLAFYLRQRTAATQCKMLLSVVFVYTITMAIIILPHTETFLIPVTFYLLVICLMTMLAALQSISKSVLFSGAMLFMISDTFIALNKFVVSIPYSGLIVMLTYYTAQGLLTAGVLHNVYSTSNKS